MLTKSDQLRALPRPLLQALRRELGPDFVNDQQRRFFDCEAPEVLYSGAFGAGKSRIGCEKAYWLAKRYPGIPIGIFRKHAVLIRQSTQETLFRDVIPQGEGHWNGSTRTFKMHNGSKIMFFGLDPDTTTGLPRIGSVELGWAFVDEAAECNEADWVQVMGRLRWPGIPYHQIAGATNPASPMHWLKRRFTPPTESRVYLHATTFDNPRLPADYIANQLAQNVGYLRDRNVMGQWVQAEGAIWNLPDDQVRVEPGPWKTVVAGVDWGFVHAFACEVIGQSGSGRLAVIDEAYHRGATMRELIPALQFMQERHGVTTFYADPSEPAYIQECRNAGLPMKEARNDVLPGLNSVTDAIAKGMTVAPSCAGLLGEIPGYTWQTSRLGLTEKPIEVNDDACDALRYAVFSLTAPRGGWGSVSGTAGGVA